MSYKHRYTVRSMPKEAGENVLASWRVIKFDRDHNTEGTYVVNKIYSPSNKDLSFLTCNCFASNKDTCRHRTMVQLFHTHDAIDTGRTFDFDKNRWFDAITQEV